MESRLEHGYVLTDDGAIQEIGTGTKTFVSFTEPELSTLRGKIFTHNHPSGSSFSASDLNLASTLKLKEIRAFGTRKNGDQWLYRLSPGAKGWPNSNEVTASVKAAQDREKSHGFDASNA